MTKIYDVTFAGDIKGHRPTLNYRQIEGALSRRQPFTGSSMSAHTEDDGTYVVLSYATVIATVRGTDVEIAENRWSTTTGRHINLCKRFL